ncbi:Ig-like domain-containing protein [Erwinia persicina]|uniref:Ig-like domain-containing protein n=1 Tax=Erwinia persicina TaxID=55211 RepID=UPI001782A674|nr:Ig-like domain-containing protein [Erwinia persicina]MBD8213743.1 Ig-like domain-containing protein [Erwinia persicina]
MAQLNDGRVDILSRDDGTLLSQASAGSSKSVLLSQPSIVKINGTRDMVAEFERQGNDLILHMKDGTTVRYQQFFFDDVDGDHSELVFDDGENPPEHALFPLTSEVADAQTAMVLTPQYESLGSIEPLLLADTGAGNGVITAAGLGALGLVGLGAAALGGGGGGGGDDDNNNGGGTNPPAATPTLTIGTFAGNNVLSAGEKDTSQLLSGTTTNVQAGQIVTIVLNGVTYTAPVQANGSWSVSVPSSALLALANGSTTITASVANSAGQTATDSQAITVEPTQTANEPQIVIGTFAGDNVLSAGEKDSSQSLSGTTTNVQAGQIVTVVLNGVTYTATVQANGSWSVSVPSSALLALANGATTITASVANSAGQTATDSQSITVEPNQTANQPQIAIGAFAGNDVLDGAEKLVTQTVSGTTLNVQQGQTVTVTLNGKTYTTVVGADGKWSVPVPAADLAALATGNASLSASVSNTSGVSASAAHDFSVQASTTPAVSITSPISGDGYLNAGEAQTTLTLSGTASGVAPGTQVSVTLGGQSYTATTQANGSWSVQVPSADLLQLPQGSNLIVATITLPNGSTLTNSTTVTVDVITTLPSPAIDLPFGDGVLSGQEAGQPQTITGNTGVIGAGQTVSVVFNGNTYTGTVSNNGTWSVTLPAGAVAGQIDATLPMVVNVTDPAGNTGSTTLQVRVDSAPPLVSNIQFDTTLNAADISQPLTVTGISAGGQSVTITLEGKTYTTTVNPDGSWSVNIPSSALQLLGQGGHNLVVTSTDQYGNVSTGIGNNLNVDTQPPAVTLAAVTGDNYVSVNELGNLSISGTAESGSIIRVFIGDRELSLTATANGSNGWTIVLSDADKAALADGSYPIRVVATDAAGNEGTALGNVVLAVEPGSQPSLTINPFAGDGILQNGELLVAQELSGSVLNIAPGQIVTVVFNGKTYDNIVVQPGGIWHVSIPASEFTGLANGATLNYSASVTDPRGGTITQPGSVSVVRDPLVPALGIAPVSDDNWINAAEAKLPVTLSGSSQNLAEGTELTVTFNNKIYSATVDANGNWSTTIPPADLLGVANGTYAIVVTDPGNTSVTATLNIGVQANFPDNVTVNAAFGGDNVLNLTESGTPQTLSGNTGLTLPDQLVTVQLNGKTYTATVNTATGAWSVNLSPEDLSNLPQGGNNLVVVVRDAAGNQVTHTASVSVDTLSPELSVGPVAGDGIVNRAEQGQPLPVTGTAEANSTITVVLNGVTYQTTANGNGSWNLNIAPSALQTLADGQYDIRVTARDSSGNETTTLIPVTIDTASPTVTVAPVSGDGYLNALEHAAALAITGTTEPGAAVVVSVNNVNYTATVDPQGNWTVTLPANVVSGLADGSYTVSVTATDAIGNTGSSSQPLTVIAGSGSLPQIAVGAFAGDNILDGAEKGLSQLMTGTTSNVQAGQVVTVTLNGSQYTGLVQGDGSWSVLVPAAALINLANGTDNYTVSVSDVAGNPASSNGSFTVDNSFSAIAIGVISDDNTLNASEALLPLSIHGFSRFVTFGSTVTVSFRGKSYVTTTNSDGSWAVNIPAADLVGLLNGNQPVTASTVDVNGNTITVVQALNSEVNPGFQPVIDPLFGDGYLNAAEAGSVQIISGSSGVAGAGQTVRVVIGGITYTGTVDAQGNWNVSVPSAALQSLPQGENPLSVTLGDTAGNSVKVDTLFEVDTRAPVVSLDAVATDNRINLAEQNEVQIIGGSGDVGDRITVTLNGQTYLTIVDGTGNWQIELPVSALKALPAGSSNIQVTSTDDAGNTSTVIRTVEVDITPPPVSVNPVSGGYINAAEAGQPLTITGSGEAGDLIRVELGNISVTVVVGSNGQWSALIPGTALSGVADGSYSLTVTATDPAGNTTTTSTPLAIDTGVPSIFVNNVTANNVLDGAEQQVDQLISGTASNVEAGQTLTLVLTGNGGSFSTTTTIQSGGAWQASLPASVLEGLANGTYTLTATVTDKAGNTGTTDKVFSVNDAEVAIAVSPISEDGYLNFTESQAAGGLDVTLTTSNVPAGSRVTFELNNITYNGVQQPDGSWTVNIPRSDVIQLTNGTLTGTATVLDPDDAVLATSEAPLIVRVSDLPQPILDTPVFGDGTLDNAEAAGSQILQGTTGVSGNGQTVEVNIGGTIFNATVNSSGVWSLTLTSADLQALPAGTQPIIVTATDAAGNTASTAPAPVNIATVLPELTLETIAGDGIINATEQTQPLDISGTTTAGNTVVVTLDGKTYNAVVDANGNWTATIPAGDLALLDDGGYDVTVTVTDPAGNKTVDTELVQVNTAAPVYTLDPLAGDGIIDSAEAAQPLKISGTGTVGDTVSVTLGGETLTTTVGNDGKWSVTAPVSTLNNLDEGTNPVTVVVTSPAGNSVTQNATVALDTTIVNPLLVNPVTGDDVVNASEADAGITITGSVPEGTTSVVVTFNNQSYTATVGSDGLWSAAIPAGAFTGLADNGYTLTVVATPQGGSSVTVNRPIVLDTTPSQPTINTPFGDGYLNLAEASAAGGQTLSGTTGAAGAGQIVTVTVSGQDYTVTADGNGNWTLPLSSATLLNLGQGELQIEVKVTDASGNVGTVTSTAEVDRTPPALVLNPVATDNVINATEILQTVTVSGSTTPDQAGQQVSVTFNGNQPAYLATVQEDGTWRLDLPGNATQNLADGSYVVTATLTDKAGNPSQPLTETVEVRAAAGDLPTISIGVVSADDYINASELGQPLNLSGTTTNVANGQVVTITLNGQTYEAVVQNGAWSYAVPALAVGNIADGAQQVSVTVKDRYDNVADDSRDFTVIARGADLPTITINPVTSDDMIDYNESRDPAGVTITGSSQNIPAGGTITVTVNNTPYTATVDADGNWTATIPQSAAQALPQNNNTVTATGNDVAGNVATASDNFTVHTQPPLLVIDANLATDGILSLADALTGLLLGGTTGPNLNVEITIGSKVYSVLADGLGNWSTTIPSADLLALANGELDIGVSVKDAYGNTTSEVIEATVDVQATLLTVDTPFADGLLNGAEATVAQVISGTVANLPAGASLVVSVGTLTNIPAVLDGQGGWTVTLPAGALVGQGNGIIQVSVSTVDAVNPVSVSVDAELVLTTTLNPVIDQPFGDGLLNVAEAALTQTLTGTTGATGAGQTIVLTINGTPYAATVDANGVWTAILTPQQLLNLGNSPDHEIVIVVRDAAGNVADASLEFGAIVTGLPTVTLGGLPLAGDGILTLNEVAGGITLGGSVTYSGDVAGTRVIVNVNGTPIEAIITGNTWSLELPAGTLTTLPDGNWPVSVTVTDGAGNVGAPVTTSLTVAINDVPDPVINTPFVDGLLSLAEATAGQVLRGSTGITGTGQKVTVSIDGGTPVNATVNVDGSWSLNLDPATLTGLANTTHTISVVATDSYGNSVPVSGSFDAILNLPDPTIVNPFGPGLGISEAAGAVIITGTTGIPVVAGQDQTVTLKVDINGVVYDGVVDASGTWTVTLPQGALSGLSNGAHQITVTVIDAAGNPATETLDFNAYLTLPQPTLAVPFDNGYLNEDTLAGAVLTGTTGAVGAGQSVSVSFGGLAGLPAVVNNDGTWSLTLTAGEMADIRGLGESQQNVVITVTDPGGNTNTLTEGFIIDTLPPAITALSFAGDNILDYVESLNTQTLTGTSGVNDAGATVTLTIGTRTLTGVVGADGKWTINVGAEALTELIAVNGSYSVAITDAAGNTTTLNDTVALNINPTQDAFITLVPVNGDNIVNALDPVTTTLSGALNNVPLTVSGVISITVGGVEVATIPVDALRANNNFSSEPLANALLGTGSQTVVVTFTPDNGTSVSATSTLLIDVVPPTVAITQFAGDNTLTATEAAVSQTITGTASDIGSTVSVTLGSKTYTAVVQAGGTWTVNVPSADLQALSQGGGTITASVKDAAGNTGDATRLVVIDTVAPLLDVDALLGNNVLNSVQAVLTQTLTGKVEGADGQTISVYLGNSGTPLAQGTVLNGAFSLALTPTALADLLQGGNLLTVRVQDENGNQTSASITVNKVFNSLLALNVDTVFGETGLSGYLGAAEAGLDQLITGTAVSAIGGLVSLTLGNGEIVTATVGQGGRWTLVVPTDALAALGDGTVPLDLVLTDVVGNVANATASVTNIINNLPVVGTLTNLFGTDNLINVLEAQAGQTIGGTLNAVAGSTVTVTLGAKAYTTTVQAGGAWSVNLSPLDLLALGTGNLSLGVKVVDPAGNTASNSVTVGVFNKQPEITLNTIFGDGVLNLADITNFASQLITGTVKNVAAGSIVTVNLGGLVDVQATVDASGKFSTSLSLGQLQLLTGNALTVSAQVTDIAGNTATATGGLQLSLTPPSLTLNQTQLFGDGLLNAADALTTQLISGVTSGGARVVVTVGNSTTPLVAATADANGVFSLGLTPSMLASLGDGSLSLKVTVTDTAGNSTSNALNAIVGIHSLPSVTINPLFGDGILSVSEALSSLGQLLSGRVNNVAAGTRVDIKLGALSLEAVTDASGNFSVALSSLQLLSLATGNLTVSATVTDVVGNTANSSLGVTIGVTTQPTLTVNTLFGDGILSASELAVAQTISGTTTNAVAGSTVTFSINGKSYSTTVGSSGSWSVSVPKADLSALPNGPLTVNATLADPYGNTATGSSTASVIAQTPPSISIGTLFGDGGLNAVEALTAQTISGTATNAEGSTISVHVGAATLTAIVAANGTWSVSVPSSALLALADATQSITAELTNGAGKSASGSASVIVGTHSTPTVTLGTTAGFSDGYLNLAESGTAQTITGTSTNAAGGTVRVVIEGNVYSAAVGSNGSWSVTVPPAGLSGLSDGVHSAAISVTDRAGNVANTSASFTSVTQNLPVIGVDPVASLLSVLLTGLTISGGTLRLATGTTVNITLTQSGQSQSMTATVGSNGRYSAKFVGGLLSSLNLSSVVTVTAVDTAGNPASTVTTLLLGSLIPLASTSAVMMAAASDDSLAVVSNHTSSATTEESSAATTVHTAAKVASTLVTDSDTSSTDSASTSAAASTAAVAETAAAVDDGSYTIGGVSILLADGQTLHGESVTGSEGSDTISATTLDFTHIDGGAGIDTLVLNGEHMTLDLTALGLKIENVEIIDLGLSGSNSIKLDLNEALNITDKPTDDLFIKGTLGDQVTLANTEGGVWATTGQRTVEGQTFDVYHNSALSSDNTLGDVLIQHNLQVHVV